MERASERNYLCGSLGACRFLSQAPEWGESALAGRAEVHLDALHEASRAECTICKLLETQKKKLQYGWPAPGHVTEQKVAACSIWNNSWQKQYA